MDCVHIETRFIVILPNQGLRKTHNRFRELRVANGIVSACMVERSWICHPQ